MILIYIFILQLMNISILVKKQILQVAFLMLMLILKVVLLTNLLKIFNGQKEQLLKLDNIKLVFIIMPSMLLKSQLDINSILESMDSF